MKKAIKERKNKKRIKLIIELTVFMLILFTCFFGVNNVVKRKNSYTKTADFFSQKQDFDVLFFGTSHVLNGVFPMQLWNDYGINSFNFGNHAEIMSVSYYNILLACEQTNPKLIVIDTYSIIDNKKTNLKKSYAHNMLDIYPLSYTKFVAVNDIFPDEDILDRNFEFLFNFSMYHTRWNELKEDDFKNNRNYEKGAESRIAVAQPDKNSNFNSIDSCSVKETGEEIYLRKIIEYCKEKNIDILLTHLPYPFNDKQAAFSKYAQTISEEYNVNYINFLNEDVINYDTDCYDKNSHLNPSGARKVTDYLGKYIIENYNIEDQRNNSDYEFWNEDYNKYIDFKIENFKKNEENINNYLMLLAKEQDIRYEVNISSKLKIEDESVLKKLLNNLENNYKIDDDVFNGKQNKVMKITTWDKRNNKEISTVWF